MNNNIQKPLAKHLRSQLEASIKAARQVAETAALAALQHVGVGDAKAPPYLTDDQMALRRRLRAHGRSLGDKKAADDTQGIQHLVWETGYEHWHRMLFARFLAENHLLLWEPGAPVTLAECDELAQDPSINMGAKSGWELAGKLAARMLPQVFKANSPVLELTFAREHQRELEKLLAGLSEEVFKASDSLGWVYQFWQAQRKDAVNAAEIKIGADELPALTQLFTEPYMVDFLLHNSLGAWWVTRHPGQQCPVPLSFLRTLEDGTPAAGKFEGWPNRLVDFRLLDPCCGSGHFLVAAFLLLVPMRMAEGLSAMDAVDFVLQQNLHGLELDPRCVEIAVFALALAAWRYPNEAGVPLGVRADMPAPNVACCGLPVTATAKEWELLVPDSAAGAEKLKQDLRLLHTAFSQAPLLGSLLDPSKSLRNDLAGDNFQTLQAILEQALSDEDLDKRGAGEGGAWEIALTARGLLAAARLLSEQYHLVTTNVPYLLRAKQADGLRDYCETYYPNAKTDLANVFLERCHELALPAAQGVVQIVMPQSWLFLNSYRSQREELLQEVQWNLLARLGAGAFETISGEIVQVILLTQTRGPAKNGTVLRGIDVSNYRDASTKAAQLRDGSIFSVLQRQQLQNPDARITLEESAGTALLSQYADGLVGLQTSDDPMFVTAFWEHGQLNKDVWELMQGTPSELKEDAGMHWVVRWERGEGLLLSLPTAYPTKGLKAIGKAGISVHRMKVLFPYRYAKERFHQNVAVILPKDSAHLAAIWCFCSSPEYSEAVRRIDQSLKVTNATLVKVPFDLARWQRVADETYPLGLPKPYSDDPTQWVFHGHPVPSRDPLQVAVVRLLGYQWPAELDETMELSREARTWISRAAKLAGHTDDDGIVCLPAVRGEKAAHERLLALLIEAWNTVSPGSWNSGVLDKLLQGTGAAGKTLAVWLRENFFEEHIKLFQHRPFIWHVWDGLKDGFGALVNYHKLNGKNLEKLIHTYLGDWIRQQDAAVTRGVEGAQIRLSAAIALKQQLEAILEGEPPYDLFARWKPVEHQPMGWAPDLDDGLRVNIRPFMTANVLRHSKKPRLNIGWEKDRGKDPDTAPWFKAFNGDRVNDHHLTLSEKQAARKAKGLL